MLLLDAHKVVQAHCAVVCRYVGNKPSPHRRKALQRLHPAGLTDDWGDKLAGRAFFSHNLKATFEHYLQARRGSVRARPHGAGLGKLAAYAPYFICCE